MRSLSPTSLATPRSADTLRLRWLVNEQQRLEIGARLRELRDNSPETNRSISDYVGVAERTVAGWASGKQGITYDHAQEVAKLFDVDLDWFWRGREKEEKPDLLDSLSQATRSEPAEVLEAIDQLRKEVAAQGAELLAEIAAVRKELVDAGVLPSQDEAREEGKAS